MAYLLNDSLALTTPVTITSPPNSLKYPIAADSTLAEVGLITAARTMPHATRSGMRRELEMDYLPAQVDDIVEHARQIEQAKDIDPFSSGVINRRDSRFTVRGNER